MFKIDNMPASIDIGFVGEKSFRTIEIDMTKWMEKMPNGIPSIVHIRPGETLNDAYIADTTFEDNILRWVITQEDLGGIEGTGTMQIWLEESENNTLQKRGKSILAATQVYGAINDPNDLIPPARTMLLHLLADVITLSPGSDASVELVQDQYNNYTLHFKIPKGEKGDPGAKGDDGDPADASLVTSAVNSYLSSHISNPSNPPLDRTLASNAAAAPADLVGNIRNTFGDALDMKVTTFTVVEGKYIEVTGAQQTSSNFNRSTPIQVSKGDVIRLFATGYQTSVAMIAKTDANASAFISVVPSIDSNEHLYSYTCPEDGYIVISYKASAGCTLTIYGSRSNFYLKGKVDEFIALRLPELEDAIGFEVIVDETNATMSDTGHYTDNAGHTQSHASFNRSASIALAKGETIKFNAKGYSTSVAVLASVVNSAYTPLIISQDSDEHNFSYTAPAAMNVVISTNKSVSPKYCIFKSKVSEHDPRIDALEDSVDMLTESLDISVPTFTETEGYYISNNGTKTSSSLFSISSPIPVAKGSVFKLTATGYQTNIAMISLSNSTGTTFTPVAVCEDSSEHTYTYSVKEDGYIVISYDHRQTCDITLYGTLSTTAIEGRVAELETIDVHSIETGIGLNTVKTDETAATDQQGKYVNASGIVDTSSNYNITEEITIPKGCAIAFKCAGYNNDVAVLAKVNTSSYTPLVISTDSQERTYYYITDEEIDVVISTHKNTDAVYSIFSSRVGDAELKIKDLSEDIFPFTDMGVIGDSLASGASNDGTYTLDHPKYSWGKYIQRKYGVATTLFSAGGLTTKTWLTHQNGLAALQSADPLECYIIGLGVNDATEGAEYLGTVSDINVGNESQNADSYYGNYSKIIAAIKTKSPNAKIFCLTNPRANTQVKQDFNDAVRDIVELYTNTFLVDLEGDEFYYSAQFNSTWASAHSNAVGYKLVANNLYSHFSKIIRNDMASFADVQFII